MWKWWTHCCCTNCCCNVVPAHVPAVLDPNVPARVFHVLSVPETCWCLPTFTSHITKTGFNNTLLIDVNFIVCLGLSFSLSLSLSWNLPMSSWKTVFGVEYLIGPPAWKAGYGAPPVGEILLEVDPGDAIVAPCRRFAGCSLDWCESTPFSLGRLWMTKELSWNQGQSCQMNYMPVFVHTCSGGCKSRSSEWNHKDNPALFIFTCQESGAFRFR